MLKEGGYRSSAQDYVALVASRGGTHELSVTRESTVFCTTLPAEEMPLALWVGAGRFTRGALTEENRKAAVDRLAQESEMYDAQIQAGRAPNRLRHMAFLGSYSLAHETLANPDDLDSISLSTLRKLHRESYVARRSAVALSGGFSLEEAKKKLAEHFYAAPRGTRAPSESESLVAQKTPRFSMAEDKSAKTPAAWYGWIVPRGEKRAAMNVALSLLTDSKRMAIVGKGRAAKSIKLHLDESSAVPGLARLEIIGNNSRSLGTIEKHFDTQLRAMGRRAPRAEEVLAVQRTFRERAKQRLETPEERARALARGVLFGRSPDSILLPLKEDAPIAELSPENVRLAALELLAPHRRSAVEIYPKGWQDPWQVPMRQYHIVQKGHTLGSIANRYGTSVAVITKMNGISRNKPIYPGDKLRVPRSRKKPAKKPRVHEVRRGDTLSGLARKYGVRVRDIASANGMGSKQTIRTGESLRIPWGGSKNPKGSKSGSDKSSGSSKSGSTSSYKVRPGDTLSGIAAKQGVSTVALARANGISHKAMVKVGQKLRVPARGTGKPAAKAPSFVTYKVRKGDTLSGIAKKNGVTVRELTVVNGIGRKSTLRLGQSLKIPKM